MQNFNKDIEKELVRITSEFLAESDMTYQVKIRASLSQHLGIDSLGRAELFRRIEKNFKVRIPDSLLVQAETLKDIADYLQRSGMHQDETLVAPVVKRPIDFHTEVSSVNPLQAETLIEVLQSYAQQSPQKAHIYFQTEEGKEEIITYSQLLAASLKIAAGLKRLGLNEGETVAIMQPTSPWFFYSFFGVLFAGGIPVPIYPPFRMHMLASYAKTEARILKNAAVRILITFTEAEKLSHLLKAFVPSLKSVTTPQALYQADSLQTPFAAKASDFAFIQYTSGSTSDPKGVLLTHANLLANIRAYGKAVNITPQDVTVSWLPLYHDMGLIGMWLGSLYFGIPLVLLTPFSFLSHPEKWLWAIHRYRGTLSGAPNFAYELCVRKIDPALIEGLDLSSWRVAANGAEKIYPRTLEQFASKFAPYQFKRETLLPVYGLAESTVALLIPEIGKEFRIDHIDRKQFEENRIALPVADEEGLAYVSCGKPIVDHDVRIVDENMNVLPERQVGQLQFRGPSMMQGYYQNPEATSAILHDGWLDSGDLAYQAEGEFFITGRSKDLIIKAGRNLYPAEIEEIVGRIEGVRQGCTIAFGITDNERRTERLVVVAETREKSKSAQKRIIANIQVAIASALDMVPDQIILVPPHVVPKTSSGKLQRAACKQMFLKGQLGKKRLPPSFQVAKLWLSWLLRTAKTLAKNSARLVYTLYLLAVLLITISPVYLVIRFAPVRFSRKLVRYWTKFLLFMAACPLKVSGKHYLGKPSAMIYACNHASYIDTLILIATLPADTRFVAKQELLSVPFLGASMRKLGHFFVNRLDLSKGLQDTKEIEEALRAGASILIFPEGTFTYAAGLRPFRLGAFKLSAETGTPICPIALQGTRHIFRDEEILLRPGKIMLTISEPIYPTGSAWRDIIQIKSAVREQIAKYCGEPSLDFIVAQKIGQQSPK